jgi:ABC-2 type transport system ATP-binding protein
MIERQSPASPSNSGKDAKPGKVRPRTGGTATIEALNVSKWFGEKVAVSDISFAIGPGVTALLGPNGAGKSTLLKLMTGQLRPSRGEVRVLGGPVRNNLALYRQLGLVPEHDSLYPFLTAQEFVELAARLHHLAKPRQVALEALSTVEMLDAKDRKLGGFSKGMRQRVKIAQALVNDPRVLLLDEPLTGTDPRQRLVLMELFARLGGAGRTVLVSSHILNEVERIGSNILVIVNGKLAAEGNFHAIRGLMDDRPIKVSISSTQTRALAARLVQLTSTQSIRIDGDHLIVETKATAEFHRVLPLAAQQSGARLTGIEGLDEDLESVFRYLVG